MLNNHPSDFSIMFPRSLALFGAFPWFFQEISLIDCFLLPLFWRHAVNFILRVSTTFFRFISRKGS